MRPAGAALMLVALLAPTALALGGPLFLSVTFGHHDAPSTTADCPVYVANELRGWDLLREATWQRCIGSWAVTEGDAQHLRCINEICETRAAQWIFYLDETRHCVDPCNVLFERFAAGDHVEFVYANGVGSQLTDRLD